MSTQTILEAFNGAKFSAISSRAVQKNSYRLDVSFYGGKSFGALDNRKTKRLGDFCKRIFNPPIFKREFQLSDDNGCRYLASAEIISWFPETTFISDEQAEQLDLKVSSGWILVSGFGTIGSTRIVDKLTDGFAIANNVTRIIPLDIKGNSGYLAAFLSSPIGNALLNDRATGSVVRYIEAPAISELPIPIFEGKVVGEINDRYLLAAKHRELAQKLLDETDDLVIASNGLPYLSSENIVKYDSGNITEAFLVNSKSINKINGDSSEFRLDAHFYNPMAQLVVKNIKGCGSTVIPLFKLTERIFFGNRSKRNYVELKNGLPFLSGKNIIQIRPEVKHISRSQTENIQELLLEKDWILITRSGTVGRTCFVLKNYENYAASEHIIRIVPKKNEIDPGYLYAFLTTDYGYEQILRHRHGSVIDEITDSQLGKVLVPIPSEKAQKAIGDKVRSAFEKRAEAIRLEDEAQQILMKALNE